MMSRVSLTPLALSDALSSPKAASHIVGVIS